MIVFSGRILRRVPSAGTTERNMAQWITRRLPPLGGEKNAGFTLVELTIVVAVITIISAVAIAIINNARLAANETSAMATLRAVVSANVQYRLRFRDYAGSLQDLHDSGYLEAGNVLGVKAGYTFSYGLVGGPPAGDFTIQADPTDPGLSGTRFFFADQSGVIRFSTTGTAGSSDPPVDSGG
jgi:type IV pilus assembly protein PilA